MGPLLILLWPLYLVLNVRTRDTYTRRPKSIPTLLLVVGVVVIAMGRSATKRRNEARV